MWGWPAFSFEVPSSDLGGANQETKMCSDHRTNNATSEKTIEWRTREIPNAVLLAAGSSPSVPSRFRRVRPAVER